MSTQDETKTFRVTTYVNGVGSVVTTVTAKNKVEARKGISGKILVVEMVAQTSKESK